MMDRPSWLTFLVIAACIALIKGELFGNAGKRKYSTNPGTGNGKAFVETNYVLKEGELQDFKVYVHKQVNVDVSAKFFLWSQGGASNEFILDYSTDASLPREEGLYTFTPDPKPWVKEGSFMGWAYKQSGDVISFDYHTTRFNTEYSFNLQAGDPFPWPQVGTEYVFDSTPLKFDHAIAVNITVGRSTTSTSTTTTTTQTTTTSAVAPVASDTDSMKGYSIQCYVCNSNVRYEGKVCDDPFDEKDIAVQSLLTNCSARHNTCMKMIQEVQKDKRIIRQCTEDAEIGKVERAGTKDIKLFYYGCESGKCNSATTFYKSCTLLFIFAAAALSIIIKS